MPRSLSLRWWLPLAFGLIAAVTAVAVAQVFSGRAEDAFRDQAEEIAVGNGLAAASAVNRALRRGDLPQTLEVVTNRRQVALFVFDATGRLVSAPRSRRTDLASVPFREVAVDQALDGRSFVRSFSEGRAAVVSRPLATGGALLVYAPRPELAAGLGIARDKIVEAAIWAAALGALTGFLIAQLLGARLRRIAMAAAAIEAGTFDVPVERGFPDEFGALAESIDRMRERLRESFQTISSERDRLHVLLARLREGVLTVDADLVVEDANAAADALLGGGSPLRGSPLPDPWPGASLRELTRRLFEPGADVTHARVSPHREQTLSVVGLPAGPEASTAVLVVTDVTEGERRERAQREFVANAAHELRSPLSVISGAVEMLEAGAKDDPSQLDHFLAHIRRESSRLARLVRALLVLARAQGRAEPLRIDAVRLAPLLESAAAAIEAPPGVRLRVTCPPDLSVLGHAELVEHVVGNVLDNARKHTEEGEIAVAAFADAEGVVIEVSDTGRGMEPREVESVFERFYRGEKRGADGFGLGLAIVREAVTALGGEVDLRSALGRGTTVRIRLRAPGAEVAA